MIWNAGIGLTGGLRLQLGEEADRVTAMMALRLSGGHFSLKRTILVREPVLFSVVSSDSFRATILFFSLSIKCPA